MLVVIPEGTVIRDLSLVRDRSNYDSLNNHNTTFLTDSLCMSYPSCS